MIYWLMGGVGEKSEIIDELSFHQDFWLMKTVSNPFFFLT